MRMRNKASGCLMVRLGLAVLAMNEIYVGAIE